LSRFQQATGNSQDIYFNFVMHTIIQVNFDEFNNRSNNQLDKIFSAAIMFWAFFFKFNDITDLTYKITVGHSAVGAGHFESKQDSLLFLVVFTAEGIATM